MSTLLLRLAAPLQSWGVDAKFERRGTERVPTKSGVIGLVAAALGRRRNESVEDLQALRFGVRVDRDGTLLRDYHTAKNAKTAYVTHRYYLSDAVFLAGLEGDDALLMQIEHALRYPAFPTFLGRRSCPPEGRVSLGIRQGETLLDALQQEPWLAPMQSRIKGALLAPLRIVLDASDGAVSGYFQRDVPLSFDQIHRQFGFRLVAEFSTPANANFRISKEAAEGSTQHDAMWEWEA
jgi:CRISPR system Cascade subunit CasD